jgi:lysophospholipase L1-like esterase
LATVAQHAVKLELDYLVFLLGANEMFRANSSEHPLDRPDVFREQPQPGWKTVLFRFQLFRRIRVLFNRLRGTDYHVTEPGGEPYFAARIGEIQDLPVLSAGSVDVSESALADYESNVVSLAALARAHETTPLFLTQPALWKEAMSDREEAVDWLIGTVVRDGQRYRVTPAAQAQALEKLNKRLLETCARRALICVDLESRIPRTLEYFYDSVHFNEAGAERVAASVAESLLTAPH